MQQIGNHLVGAGATRLNVIQRLLELRGPTARGHLPGARHLLQILDENTQRGRKRGFGFALQTLQALEQPLIHLVVPGSSLEDLLARGRSADGGQILEDGRCDLNL